MMNGKEKCKLLKEIREEIARENNIEFESEECTFEGDCSGTCPKCEEELRYLENEIDKKDGKTRAIFKLDKSKDTDEISELDGMPPLDFIEPLDGLPVEKDEILEERMLDIDKSEILSAIELTGDVPMDSEKSNRCNLKEMKNNEDN